MVDCSSCNSSVVVKRKRSRTLRIKLQGPGDLTDAKIWFSVKEDYDDLDSEALITKKSSNNGGSTSEAQVVEPYILDTDEDSPTYNEYIAIIEVYIVPADTAEIEPGNYLYDVVIETAAPASRRLQAVNPSEFQIDQPITLT